MQPVYLTYSPIEGPSPPHRSEPPVAVFFYRYRSPRLSPVTHPLGPVGGVRDALIAPESDYT